MTTTRPSRQRTVRKCHVCAQFAQAKNFIAIGIMGQVKRNAAISGSRPQVAHHTCGFYLPGKTIEIALYRVLLAEFQDQSEPCSTTTAKTC
jgi:hypothetical protein